MCRLSSSVHPPPPLIDDFSMQWSSDTRGAITAPTDIVYEVFTQKLSTQWREMYAYTTRSNTTEARGNCHVRRSLSACCGILLTTTAQKHTDPSDTKRGCLLCRVYRKVCCPAFCLGALGLTLVARWLSIIGPTLPAECSDTLGSTLPAECSDTVGSTLPAECSDTVGSILLAECSDTVGSILLAECSDTAAGRMFKHSWSHLADEMARAIGTILLARWLRPLVPPCWRDG